MKSTTTIGIAALLLGGAGGYFAGKAGSNHELSDAMPNDALHDTSKTRPDSAGSANAAAGTRTKKARTIGDIMEEPGQMARMQALMELYAGMDSKQLQAEAEKLGRLPMNQRLMASFLLFGRWGEVDPQGALEQTRKMGMGGMFVRPTVLQSWASIDPVSAANYFSQNPREFAGRGGPGPMGGDNGASVIAAEWAKLDPTAALAWANGLTGGEDKSSALSSIVREVATKDPSKAAQIAAGLSGDDQVQAYQQIAAQWSSTDFGAAKAWINTLPAESREQALASALASYAATDPVKAAAEVSGLTGDAKNQAIGEIAQAWARTDPAKAAEWVASQQTTGENGNNGAIRNVMFNWVNEDSSAALSFIQKQPQGELRDQAVASYVFASRDTSPKDNVALAESISDERSRNRAIMASAGRWMQEDEAAAKAYVESSTALSDEAKDAILNGRGGQWGGGGGRGGFGGGGNGGGRGGRGR